MSLFGDEPDLNSCLLAGDDRVRVLPIGDAEHDHVDLLCLGFVVGDRS